MFRGNRGHGNRPYHGGRGRGRGRGGGGWGNRNTEGENATERDNSGKNNAEYMGESSNSSFRGEIHRGGGGRGGRPPNLRGRDIGLYYAAKSKQNAKERETDDALEIKLDEVCQATITTLLKKFEPSLNDNHFMEASSNSVQSTERSQPSAAAGASFSQDSDMIGISSLHPGLTRDPHVDNKLKEELHATSTSSSKHTSMQNFRKTLPAFYSKDEILSLVSNNQVVVISGETGCGKTTQVGQFILDEMIVQGNGSLCNVLCTQPRRISAITVAERVAEERNEGIGAKSVGYIIRLESRLPYRTRGTITFCTTGIVFQYLKSDPYLKDFSHIIVDEVHERDTNSDILIAILKDLMNLRRDLKVILMSATINAEHFSKYFNNCPMFNIAGLTFPVTEFYLEDVIERTKFEIPASGYLKKNFGRGPDRMKYTRWESEEYDYFMNCYIRKLQRENNYSALTIREISKPESEDTNSFVDIIQALLEYICETDSGIGAVLVFVPGWEDISKLNTQLLGSGKFSERSHLIIPLHSLMPTVNQKQVFNRPPNGIRKIVIATNIAETSITIDDIVYVIDGGKIKMTNFDLRNNLETLETEWVSRANAKQRKGRAGRVQAGICYHLFSKAREEKLDDFKKPEILRKRLEEVILQLKILKLGDVRTFFQKLLDPPSKKSVDLSFERLIHLSALDADEELTPLGVHLAHLPMDPQTGKIVLMGAMFSCIDPVFSIAASLSFKDAFLVPLGKEKLVDRRRGELSDGTKSDHYVTVKVIEGYELALSRNNERNYCYQNFLSPSTCNLLVNFKKQFAGHLHRMKFLPSTNCKDPNSNINSTNIALVKAVICAGLYPNIAKIRPRRNARGGPPFPNLTTPEDGKVMIHPKSVNSNELDFECPFVMYHLKQKSSKIFLYDTSMISPYPIVFFGRQLQFIKNRGITTLVVDGNFQFKIEKSTFDLLQALRSNMDKVLENKIRNPQPSDWSDGCKEGSLLRAIRELMSAEYHQIMSACNYDYDSD